MLLLDNCEHLIDGVRSVIERILAASTALTVLATSRSRLTAPWEWVYEVPGLSVTDDGGDAVELFAARVAAADHPTPPDPRRIAGLCRALDGMALAIELAAARYPTLGMDGLETALDERLRFLTFGMRVADRHRSLRDAITWSYDLLSPDDQALLQQVSAFASWFDVEAATAIVGGHRSDVTDGLARLANDSLLVVRVENRRVIGRSSRSGSTASNVSTPPASTTRCDCDTTRGAATRPPSSPLPTLMTSGAPTSTTCSRTCGSRLQWSSSRADRRRRCGRAGPATRRVVVPAWFLDGGAAPLRAGRRARAPRTPIASPICVRRPVPRSAATPATTPFGCIGPPLTSPRPAAMAPRPRTTSRG